MRTTSITVRVPEAAAICGLPPHVLKKSFMCPAKRPKGIPAPPPHVRVGRAIFIFADKLPEWVAGLGGLVVQPAAPAKLGAPTKAQRIAKREALRASGGAL